MGGRSRSRLRMQRALRIMLSVVLGGGGGGGVGLNDFDLRRYSDDTVTELTLTDNTFYSIVSY